MPPAGFEPANTESEWQQTHDLQVVEMSESVALSIHSFRLVTTERILKEHGTGG